MHRYIPHTPTEVSAMLTTLRLNSIDDLFKHLPNHIRYRTPYIDASPLSDDQLKQMLMQSTATILTSFRGFGAYDHERPAIIDALASRQEFLTSYTPYQPEVAQGTLQYIFEFQSIITELTGMDVSNASMYDGPTAASEAMMMAVNHTGIARVLVADNLLPHVLATIQTYCHFREVKFVPIATDDNGQISRELLAEQIKEPFASLLIGYPNKYGIIENYDGISTMVHEHGGLLITYADLLALTIFKTPAQFGSDIVCGEAQTLGIPLSFGGPYLGYLATLTKYVRKMPGRICGMTKDNRGQRAYVLTLQAREQHIRREKANSNICSNQSLMALQATIYAVTMGKSGLRQVAINAIKATHYLADRLVETGLFTKSFDAPMGFEMTLTYQGDIHKLNQLLLARGYLGPQPLDGHRAVFYASEKMTKMDIEVFVSAIKECHHEVR